MSSKFIYALIFLCTSGITSFAQNKKDVKKYKIKSITETILVEENGKTITYKDHYKAFDKNGELKEEIEFLKDGGIKKKETFKYDLNNNKIEETSFCQKEIKNPKNIKIICKYNVNNDKSEEFEYDMNTGKLIKRMVCSYDNKGNREAEELFDGNNKRIKKIIYTHNNKGLKTEKKVFDVNNILESTKKYTYEF